MLQPLIDKDEFGFIWLDITGPTNNELMQVAEEYGLHPALVHDCLQPDHLPKFEKMENYNFIIFRIHSDTEFKQAGTMQGLTHKIAIFYSEGFLITIHRKEQAFIHDLAANILSEKCSSSNEVLNLLINGCLNTYQEPLNKLSKERDYYEEVVFLKPKRLPLLNGMYYLKRRADLIQRMLILSFEIINAVDTQKDGNVNTRNTRDHYIRLQNMFDALSENINQLLNIYFSASSQRANETIRILTIFSVFFMPLTFIVGIYGMNFEMMPELRWKFGYPGVLILMVLVTLFIYIWFKKKKWL